MSNNKNPINAQEAQEALNSIHEMEQAGLKRVLPPIWFGAVLALLVGILVGLVGAGIRSYTALIILFMGIAITYQYRSAGARERLNLSTRGLILLIICALSSFFLLIIAAQYLQAAFGFEWAPLAMGLLAAAIFFMLTVIARHSFFARINKQESA